MLWEFETVGLVCSGAVCCALVCAHLKLHLLIFATVLHIVIPYKLSTKKLTLYCIFITVTLALYRIWCKIEWNIPKISQCFFSHSSPFSGERKVQRIVHCLSHSYFIMITYLKGKVVLLQACSGSECSRKLMFADFMTTAQDVAKVVSLTYQPPLPLGN